MSEFSLWWLLLLPVSLFLLFLVSFLFHLFKLIRNPDWKYAQDNNIPYRTVKEWSKACDLMDIAHIKMGDKAEEFEYRVFEQIQDKAAWLKYSEWRYTYMSEKQFKQFQKKLEKEGIMGFK